MVGVVRALVVQCWALTCARLCAGSSTRIDSEQLCCSRWSHSFQLTVRNRGIERHQGSHPRSRPKGVKAGALTAGLACLPHSAFQNYPSSWGCSSEAKRCPPKQPHVSQCSPCSHCGERTLPGRLGDGGNQVATLPPPQALMTQQEDAWTLRVRDSHLD